MKRREFLTCSGAGVGAGLAALAIPRPASAQQATQQQTQLPAKPDNPQLAPPVRVRYEFEVDIVEGNCGQHKAGQKIRYPDEQGKICPWLMDSMSGAIRVLQYGGTLPWLYKGTPYEKVIDPNGITTEFIRCPDPSRVVVAKITRRKL